MAYRVEDLENGIFDDVIAAVQASTPEEGQVRAICALTNAVLALASAVQQLADAQPDAS